MNCENNNTTYIKFFILAEKIIYLLLHISIDLYAGLNNYNILLHKPRNNFYKDCFFFILKLFKRTFDIVKECITWEGTNYSLNLAITDSDDIFNRNYQCNVGNWLRQAHYLDNYLCIIDPFHLSNKRDNHRHVRILIKLIDYI